MGRNNNNITFRYKVNNDNSCTIMELTEEFKEDKFISIPEYINGHPVTEIFRRAFFENTHIERITISKNVKKIGEGTFQGCTKLEQVYLCDSCDSINIDMYAFAGCLSLLSFQFDIISSVGIYAFSDTGLTDICLSPKFITIPEGCFHDCNKLSSVKLEATNIAIEPLAFYGCDSLTKFDFSNVKTIGPSAFRYSGLKDIYLGEHIVEVGEKSFYNCPQLEQIEWYSSSPILYFTFGECSNLKSAKISSAVPVIEPYAFCECPKCEIEFV